MKLQYDKITDIGLKIKNNPRIIADKIRHSEVGVAVGVVMIIIIMITPIPVAIIDYLLAFSLIFAILILMNCLFVVKAKDFSIFPMILLIAAMLRLSLNIATTRIILSEGHQGTQAAGEIIRAFGQFMTQGNPVIGFIVFSILVIVNFIVITKGAGRISEVAARFSLDAMPGKQVAIDSELASGAIDEKTAQQKRKELENETSFYGSMDGASKFVRGDAVAGLIITFINIIGGIIIGIFQKDMDIVEALQNYTILTIGDGLISQVPALIISTAAGIIVSKGSIEETTNEALTKQIAKHPKSFVMASIIMFIIALLPQMPLLPFMSFSAIAAFIAFNNTNKNKQKNDRAANNKQNKQKNDEKNETTINEMLDLDDIRLEIGYALLEFVNSKNGDLLSKQVKQLRQQFAKNMGFIIPAVRIIDNMAIDKNKYTINIKEIEAATGSVFPNMHMVMAPDGSEINLPGIRVKDPVFKVPATWIDPKNITEANARGYTVIDAISVMTTHISEIIRNSMADLLDYEQTAKLIDNIKPSHQKLVSELIPSKMTITTLKCVLQNLLKEQISIRNINAILEAIAEIIEVNKNPDIITEIVRAKLAWQISNANLNKDGVLPLIPISPKWDEILNKNIVGEDDNKKLSLEPKKIQEFINKVKTEFEKAAKQGEIPVLLTNGFIRPHVRAIIERFRPQTFTMSQNEVHSKIKLKTVGSI